MRGKADEAMAAGRRAWVMTPVAWMAAGHQAGSGAVTGRIVLVAVAVLAVGAFVVLQVKARSRRPRSPFGPRRRRYDSSDWRRHCPRRTGPKAGMARGRWVTKRETGPTGDMGTLLAMTRTRFTIPPGRRGPPVATRGVTGDL